MKTEQRYVGEWEPDVHVKHKSGELPPRKVITMGVKNLNDCGVISRAIGLLRKGYEVRIGDAMRLYPCMSNDFKSMIVVAQTLGDFRANTYDGLNAHIIHRGVEVDADEFAEESASHREECAKRMAACSVTPDTMVTCPNCGTQFRVGQKLAA